MSQIFKELLPCLNRILVKQVEPSTVTKSGLLLSQPMEKTMYGEIVKSGPGAFDEEGNKIPLCVKNGDVVLLPNYGGHKVNLKDGEYYIYRDTDILGTFKQ